MIASSVWAITRESLKLAPWSDNLNAMTQYELQDLYPCISILKETIKDIHKRNHNNNNNNNNNSSSNNNNNNSNNSYDDND